MNISVLLGWELKGFGSRRRQKFLMFISLRLAELVLGLSSGIKQSELATDHSSAEDNGWTCTSSPLRRHGMAND
jgi:hypothetical protein